MQCSRGWTERCRASKGKKCTCACGGENHGKDHHFDGDIFRFKGMGVHDSHCGIRIIRRDGAATVILIELPDNPGTSVTNAVEDIATIVYKDRLSDLPPEKITWIEHYPQRGKIKETHDQVILQWEPSTPHWQGGKIIGTGKFAHPRWMPMNKPEVAA